MSGSGIGQFIPLILIFVIFYFFLIRPQQKKVKEHKLMVENLKRGDKVVTSGGIVGSIDRVIDNDKVEVLISENVKVEVVKSTGIQALVSQAWKLIDPSSSNLPWFTLIISITFWFISYILDIFTSPLDIITEKNTIDINL